MSPSELTQRRTGAPCVARLTWALALLLINTLAVIGSPGIDISNTDSLVALLVIFTIAFGGVMLGVRKLSLKVDT